MERLAEIAPGKPGAKLDRVFFAGSGSEAVDRDQIDRIMEILSAILQDID